MSERVRLREEKEVERRRTSDREQEEKIERIRGREKYEEKKRPSYSEKGVPKRNVDIVGPPTDLRRGENEVMN